MKKTQHRLMALYCCFLAVAAVLYICGEFFHVDMGVLSGATRGQKFVTSTVMILLTIGLLPLSLRLFKFRRINADLLSRKAPALLRWGSLRIGCLGTLLVVNTFLYYAFELEAAYGYLAVVVLLCLPFILPTRERCEAEVSPEPVEEAPKEETNDEEETNDCHRQL